MEIPFKGSSESCFFAFSLAVFFLYSSLFVLGYASIFLSLHSFKPILSFLNLFTINPQHKAIDYMLSGPSYILTVKGKGTP
jgi:hypothetical protein